ncbi:TB2/DP1, HVA22 family [Geosmithia morbida]|uniref:Protein YOP1 n=1 Tax=Geosmithia morbida TaxID=1094350 RepID=A0A9P5D4G7_9HYPO|nr:TB2/DP1, HVA22 family [Geosmithia morbida]KAF4122780.1 TB2/DP1, HVA22 family [Geosmithia morbida]
MFDLFAMLLSSVTSFLFPIFASYKALKTSDPAQLTPWLMYWVVFSCCMLAESWVSFILFWIPFYGYIRLLFLLYLILPQTQGARVIYQERIHPFLQENEAVIDDLIATSHDRIKAAGLVYIRRAIDFIRTKLLGQPPRDDPPTPPPTTTPQGYTQSLLARFSVPAARYTGPTDVYSLLSGAVNAAAGVVSSSGSGTRSAAAGASPSSSSSSPADVVIPPDLQSSGDRMDFIATQRERLSSLLTALDNEALKLQQTQTQTQTQAGSSSNDDEEPTQRPPSGLSAWSGLSKSRSEADFENIEADSGTEEEMIARRRRNTPGGGGAANPGGWMPWDWSSSSGVERQQQQQQQQQ